MCSRRNSATSAAAAWEGIRPGILARIVDGCLSLLLSGLVVMACLALFGYIEYRIWKRT